MHTGRAGPFPCPSPHIISVHAAPSSSGSTRVRWARKAALHGTVRGRTCNLARSSMCTTRAAGRSIGPLLACMRACRIYGRKQASNVNITRADTTGSWRSSYARTRRLSGRMQLDRWGCSARRRMSCVHLPMRACICTGQWRQKAIDGDGPVVSLPAPPAVCMRCLTFELKRRDPSHHHRSASSVSLAA